MRALFFVIVFVAAQLPLSLFSQTAQFTPWETIMERDIVSKTRIWREIDVQGKAETVVRILGIAPVYVVADKNGEQKEFAMFWIYYPDCRAYLSTFPATAQYSWDEVFNGRHFKAKITRFTPAK
jgi:hypothetical protein